MTFLFMIKFSISMKELSYSFFGSLATHKSRTLPCSSRLFTAFKPTKEIMANEYNCMGGYIKSVLEHGMKWSA